MSPENRGLFSMVFSISFGSILNEWFSISTNSGSSFNLHIVPAVAKNEKSVVITKSPLFRILM